MCSDEVDGQVSMVSNSGSSVSSTISRIDGAQHRFDSHM